MATAVFVGYTPVDDGIELRFCVPPETLEFVRVLVTDSELSGAANAAAVKALAIAKLQRKVNAANIAAKLDALVGQSITF